MDIPKSHYVYEFAYPEEMPELAGIIFYVGKGTSLSRMDTHFQEAAREDCNCVKCGAIQAVWAADLIVVRRIVFESKNEIATLNEENRRILIHSSPYFTNIKLPKKEGNTLIIESKSNRSLRKSTNDPAGSLRVLRELFKEINGYDENYTKIIPEYSDIYFGG